MSIRAVCKKAFTQCSHFRHGACSPTVSSSLNDVCCSGSALMWEIAVVCSMWQIIRHANQAEAAVESLIMVRVPHKGTFSTPHRTPRSPSRLQQPPHPSHPPPFSCCPCTPRQTDGPEAEAVGGEESFGTIGWYGWLWHRGWSGYMWIREGVTVYFKIPLKCQSEHYCCFSSAQNVVILLKLESVATFFFPSQQIVMF